VTDTFFDVLKAPVEIGYVAKPADVTGVVVSRRAMSQISQDPLTVDVPISVSGKLRTVTAVMPTDFAFPDEEIGVWLRSSTLIWIGSRSVGLSQLLNTSDDVTVLLKRRHRPYRPSPPAANGPTT
jgi:hypothetical protein